MERLKQLRQAFGLSMIECARRLGFPYTTYVNYEKGFREPNSEALILIANFFGVSIDYLIGRSDDPNGFYSEQLRDIAVSHGEQILVEAFRSAPRDIQDAVLRVLGVELPLEGAPGDNVSPQ